MTLTTFVQLNSTIMIMSREREAKSEISNNKKNIYNNN